MDVVDQPELPTVRKWVQENYTLSNFRATCNKCQEILYFVCTEALTDHIKREHEASYQFEESEGLSDCKIYRKPDDDGPPECAVCDKRVTIEETSEHQHFVEGQIVVDINHDWVFKYFRQISDNIFLAYCVLCIRKYRTEMFRLAFDEIIFLHFKRFHPEIWGEGLPFSEQSATSLGGVNLTRLNMFLQIYDNAEWNTRDWENREIAINWVKRKYKLITRFRAKCKRCLVIYSSIDTSLFAQHVLTKDIPLYSDEEATRFVSLHSHWINFKFTKERKAQCLMCSDQFFMQSNTWLNHRHEAKDDNNAFVIQYSWLCKYVTNIKDDNDDFKGCCIVCDENHILDFMPSKHLFFHIFENGCGNLMRRDDPVPGNDSQPKDDLPMQEQGLEKLTLYNKPSTSNEIN
nr:PREDICTED: uncharacterized protein LOC105667918 [Linepithema humile]XP_012215472.1 PREDICTED: uncharacterized protein LOC105667918 [Linepithema humile]